MSKDSDSPLSTRRGGADPVDINDAKLNLEFGDRGDYANDLEPHGPTEQWAEMKGLVALCERCTVGAR